MRLGLVVLIWLVSTISPAVAAQGEHGRRAGAELQVLAGDIRTLLREEARADKNAVVLKGLVDRIRGGLSAADILLRLADQEADRAPVSYIEPLQKAHEYADQQHWNHLLALLASLSKQFPLRQPFFPDSAELRESAHKLHISYCAGCHDTPAQGVERPAYNLHQQASSITVIEFYARMLVGVRGDRVTGIDNPLSDADIAGLIYFYRSEEAAIDKN
ncbi:hypothetical protein AB833_05400 [Chromatiales bacterium (ex Bugula neritina AB1)]|nr:hypothetical protein AB833_05400 [Chromatiales bacterium (ex Bugula neritina AB1)]